MESTSVDISLHHKKHTMDDVVRDTAHGHASPSTAVEEEKRSMEETVEAKIDVIDEPQEMLDGLLVSSSTRLS
jgi:hypothetical protein